MTNYESSNQNNNDKLTFISSKVKVGRSFSSKGWALNRKDFFDFIPVEKFEGLCEIQIGNLVFEAKINFNPRLFYESADLENHLEKLYLNGMKDIKVPLIIYFSEDKLFKNVDSKYEDTFLNQVDTSLRVGKSFKSKGWQLSKDVVSRFIPIKEYGGKYDILVDNIPAKAKLNLQLRLFYKSNELSNYLKELYKIDPKQKIDVTIKLKDSFKDYGLDGISKEKTVLALDSVSFIKHEEVNSYVNEFILDSTVEDNVNNQEDNIISSNFTLDDTNTCNICSNILTSIDDSILKNVSIDFPEVCESCLKKIVALNSYYKLKKEYGSSFIRKELANEIWDGENFEYYWDLLGNYNFLKPLGDLFQLSLNPKIEEEYGTLISSLNNDEGDINSTSTWHEVDDEYIAQAENSSDNENIKNYCVICGKTIDEGLDKCDDCLDKSFAIDYLKRLLPIVSPYSNFNKSYLYEQGFSNLDIELITIKLEKYGLIQRVDEDSYKLNDLSFLNQFLKDCKYDEGELEFSMGKNVITKDAFSSEEKLDKAIVWKRFKHLVEFIRRNEGYLLQYKFNGQVANMKFFSSSYEAKLAAIQYLESENKLKVFSNEDIRLKFKSKK